MYDDGTPSSAEMITPAEEVPVPYQSRRGNMQGYQQGPRGYQQGGYQQGPNGYQQGPTQNGPSRMSRQPRYVRPPDPRVTRRPPPRAEADIVPAEYQSQGPFYDDAEAIPTGGYRVSTSTANYRR